VTELAKPGTGAKATRDRRGKRGWSAVIGGFLLAVLKSHVLLRLLLHRHALIGVVAAALAGSLLRTRPVATAVATALLAALVLGAHSIGLGLALGFGGFALLMALFFAVSTILHARQRRRSRA
jgi:hypothetical protein